MLRSTLSSRNEKSKLIATASGARDSILASSSSSSIWERGKTTVPSAASLSRELQHVREAIIGNESSPRKLVLENGVGRDSAPRTSCKLPSSKCDYRPIAFMSCRIARSGASGVDKVLLTLTLTIGSSRTRTKSVNIPSASISNNICCCELMATFFELRERL